MKTVLKTAVMLASLCVAATGCGESDTQDAAKPAALPPPATTTTALKTGDTAFVSYGALDDPDGVGALKVTVTKVEDPLPPPSDDEATSKPADAGKRYVAIHTRIENIGDRVYSDSLYGAAQLIDDQGNVAEGTQLLGWSCESAFNATIPPQAKGRPGCEVYELADGVEPDRFLLTEGETALATWDVGG